MTQGRDHRIDFYRGLALVFILWDHIPNNPLAYLTLRNFGFPDAAEVFVFLAGYAALLAYGKIALRDGYLVAITRILKRAWVLYVAHIFLLALLMGIVFWANSHVEARDLVHGMNLQYFLGNPQQAMIDELLLRFKPNLMDPLPLYIVLLLSLPLILPLLIKHTGVAVALSLTLYGLTQWFDWNLDSSEGNRWFFNPFAWQAVFVLGAACARRSQREVDTPARAPRPLMQQPLFMLCLSISLVCLVLAISWKWPWLSQALSFTGLSEHPPIIVKTNVEPIRLLNFLALVYVAACVIRNGPWVQHRLVQGIAMMGRHSLEVFCLSVLLAPLADALNALGDDHLAVRIGSALAGAALMFVLAAWLDWIRTVGKKPADAQPPQRRGLRHSAAQAAKTAIARRSGIA